MARKATRNSAEGGSSRAHDALETLNFKVPSKFKKAFKGYAVAQGITMVELLREGFERSKADRR